MMNDKSDYDVVFYDSVGGVYDGDTPKSFALGGSELALVTLAELLVRSGLRVAVMNGASGKVNGVDYFPTGARIDCEVLVIQRYSDLPARVERKREFVWSSDMRDGSYDHLRGKKVVCWSEWQKREHFGEWDGVVIAPPYPEDIIPPGWTPPDRVPERYLYASAALKGLNETIVAFQKLRALRPDSTLRVCTPAYSATTGIDRVVARHSERYAGVEFLGELTLCKMLEEMGKAEAMFYVNTFTETYCLAAAFAEQMGMCVHVLSRDLGGIPEACKTGFLTTSEDEFFKTLTEEHTRPMPRPPWEVFSANRNRNHKIVYQWRAMMGLTENAVVDVPQAPHVQDEPSYVGPKPSPATPGPITITCNTKLMGFVDGDALVSPTPGELRKAVEGEQPLFIVRNVTPTEFRLEPVQSPDIRVPLADKPKIVLVMIVKNEAAVIGRAIASVAGLVDAYSIVVDETNTDKTIEVIKRARMPGHVHVRPWIGHGPARTEALDLALRVFGPNSYALMLDADDVIEYSGDENLHPVLGEADVFDICVTDAGTSYWRPHLIRLGAGCSYKGVRHEYLDTPPNVTKKSLYGVTYKRVGGGASWKNPKKFLEDAAALADELEKNPNDARSAFYMAQSLRDAGHVNDAIEAYELRGRMTCGWEEERYTALLEVVRLSIRAEKPEAEIVMKALATYAARPARAEPLYELAAYYRKKDKPRDAYLFARTAYLLPKPADALFVDDSVYEWRAIDEFSVVAFFVGDYAAGLQAAMGALRRAPEEQHDRIRKTIGFYKRAIGASADRSAPPAPASAKTGTAEAAGE